MSLSCSDLALAALIFLPDHNCADFNDFNDFTMFLGDPPFTKGQGFGRQYPHSFQALKGPLFLLLLSLQVRLELCS